MANKVVFLHICMIWIMCSRTSTSYSSDDTADAQFDFDLSDICPSEFHIEKYTMATSDSYRDNEFTMLIFPESQPEYAPHFQQDLCARQSKCFLPYSCFKLHSPQTDQHEEGYLSVEALEHEFTKKFYAVIHKYSDTQFDAFFDYNMGFWVRHLDKYLTQINDHSDVLTHYIGLKWRYPSPINKMFYSLIIQSPASQKVFELMSFYEPDLSSYSNLRHDFEFHEINEIRASFLSYPIHQGQYPWDREDAADIIPIKISYGCSDIRSHVEFYVNVLEATVLYQQNDIVSTLDGHSVSYAFLKPVNDQIEIEFVQRPIDYTYGTFTTQLYQDLLVNTHYDRITGPVCGLDRWFDNHYGFNTLKFAEDPLNYNYLDRVLDRLTERKMVWRLYHTPFEDESPEGQYWMKQYGFTDLSTLYVFDINGQTIQMFGVFREHTFAYNPPIYHKQWCYAPCPGNLQQGEFDANHAYVEDKEDEVYAIIVEENKKYSRNMKVEADNGEIMKIDEAEEEYARKGSVFIAMTAAITIGIVCCLMVTFCIYRCVMQQRNTGDASMYITDMVDGEMRSLLHPQKRHS